MCARACRAGEQLSERVGGREKGSEGERDFCRLHDHTKQQPRGVGVGVGERKIKGSHA